MNILAIKQYKKKQGKKYIRKDVPTTINLTKEQKELVEKHNINLSLFVREQLNRLFSGEIENENK